MWEQQKQPMMKWVWSSWCCCFCLGCSFIGLLHDKYKISELERMQYAVCWIRFGPIGIILWTCRYALKRNHSFEQRYQIRESRQSCLEKAYPITHILNYVDTCTYIYLYIHMYLHVYSYTNLYVYVWVCVCAHTWSIGSWGYIECYACPFMRYAMH